VDSDKDAYAYACGVGAENQDVRIRAVSVGPSHHGLPAPSAVAQFEDVGPTFNRLRELEVPLMATRACGVRLLHAWHGPHMKPIQGRAFSFPVDEAVLVDVAPAELEERTAFESVPLDAQPTTSKQVAVDAVRLSRPSYSASSTPLAPRRQVPHKRRLRSSGKWLRAA
jgi:hypothetical protein